MEIYRRGLSYFKNSHVKSFTLKDRSITARVGGQYYQEYRVAIDLTEKGIRKASCSCPYYALCKHIAAVLIYYVKKELIADENMENPLKAGSGPLPPKKIILQTAAGAKDSLDEFLGDLDPGRFLESGKPHDQRWKLVFLITPSAARYPSPRGDLWNIEPSLLYLRQNGSPGRVSAYKKELLTEAVTKEELGLLSSLADLPNCVDSLSRNLGLVLHTGSLLLFLKEKNTTQRIAFHKIRNISISFTIANIRAQEVLFTPLLSVAACGGEPVPQEGEDAPKEGTAAPQSGKPKAREWKPGEIYADANRLILFCAKDGRALYYEEDSLAVPLLHKLIVRKPRFTAHDIEELRRFLEEKGIADISVDFSAREVELVRAPPIPLIEIEEIQHISFLHLSLFFIYEGVETSSREKQRFLFLEDKPALRVALRSEEFEEKMKHYLWQLLRDSGSPRLFIDGEETIQLGKTSAQNFLETFAPRLFEEGFHIRLKNRLEKITPVKGRIRVSLASGIDWFQFKVDYVDEAGKTIDVSFDESLIAQSLLKTRDHYIYLTKEDIGRFTRLLNDGMDKEGNLKTSKLNFSLINDIKENLTDTDDPEIRNAQKIFEKLSHFEKIDPVPLPREFTALLRPYQETGYYWLSFLHAFNLGGCLADDMGLGKTVQTLALLSSLKEKGILGTSLLVVPLTTVANWESEIRRFAPALSSIRHMGTGRKRDMDFHYGYDLVITTYHTMRNDIEYFSRVPFDFCILDESQNIKNASSQVFKAAKKVQCRHRLSLTGTPIENSSLELWAQMEFLNPGLLGSHADFRARFAKPIEKERDRERAELLKRRVFPFILRRKKEDVAKDLPPKEEIKVFLELTEQQKILYDRLRRESVRRMEKAITEKGIAGIGIDFIQVLLRLRQCALIPALINENFNSIDSAKLEMLEEMLDEIIAEDHKLLIFSQFVECLKMIETIVAKKGHQYAYLDGSTRDREHEIRRFQTEDDVRIFLLSLKAGGVGINLTAADYVILFDPWWNPAVEAQAIDRTHRIGQTKKVTVYRLLAKDTVEERIEELKEKKRALVAELISSDSAFHKALTREDIMNILS
jgi:hypothetical protein